MLLNTHGLALDWLRHLQPSNFESDRRRSTLADVERSLVFHLNGNFFLFNVIFLNLNVFCDKTLKIIFFLLKSNYGPSTVCRYSRHSSGCQSGLFIVVCARNVLKRIQIKLYGFVMTLLWFRTDVTFMGFGLGHGTLGLGL